MKQAIDAKIIEETIDLLRALGKTHTEEIGAIEAYLIEIAAEFDASLADDEFEIVDFAMKMAGVSRSVRRTVVAELDVRVNGHEVVGR